MVEEIGIWLGSLQFEVLGSGMRLESKGVHAARSDCTFLLPRLESGLARPHPTRPPPRYRNCVPCRVAAYSPRPRFLSDAVMQTASPNGQRFNEVCLSGEYDTCYSHSPRAEGTSAPRLTRRQLWYKQPHPVLQSPSGRHHPIPELAGSPHQGSGISRRG